MAIKDTWPKHRNVGVSELRKITSESLAAETETLVIYHRVEPLAAMIPWKEYLRMQNLYLKAKGLLEFQ